MSINNDRPRILIVDDESGTREALARYLKTRFEVRTASDGADAIELLRNHHFDLVLTDLRMPRADGMSVLEAVRGKTPAPRCILLTAYGSIEDAVKAVKKGAFDFVPKPVKLEKLDAVIRAALGESASPVPDGKDDKKKPAGFSGVLLPRTSADPMAKVVQLAETVAPSRTTVLLTGESGTGKEVIARLIHDRSGRQGFFMPVPCAALAATLLESELFGYEKGAFTGAAERRRGRFELADGGTVFLDEIGEIDAATQVKLLRVIESRSFERVGGTESIRSDVRIIAATNRDLRKMVAEGTFREDLFYRLSVVNLELPPLRERKDEIVPLTEIFIREFAAENNRPVPSVSPEAMKILSAYSWPGNIRELKNTVECMVVLHSGTEIGPAEIPENIRAGAAAPSGNAFASSPSPLSLEKNERELIVQALARCNGNRTAAAAELGISRRTLHRKIASFGIK